MKLYSREEFLNESRDYKDLTKEEYEQILADQNFSFIPTFYRYGGEGNLPYYLFHTPQKRSPFGTNPHVLQFITKLNKDFPNRFESMFCRTTMSNLDYRPANTIVIPLRGTEVAFCPYYDFNTDAVSMEIKDPENYEKLCYDVAMENFYNFVGDLDLEMTMEDFSEKKTYNKLMKDTIYKFKPKDSETIAAYAKKIADMKNWGFIVKKAENITQDDIDHFTYKEVWFSGPALLKNTSKTKE